jgi:hypothetical protein
MSYNKPQMETPSSENINKPHETTQRVTDNNIGNWYWYVLECINVSTDSIANNKKEYT